jgi:hypothetical protein
MDMFKLNIKVGLNSHETLKPRNPSSKEVLRRWAVRSQSYLSITVLSFKRMRGPPRTYANAKILPAAVGALQNGVADDLSNHYVSGTMMIHAHLRCRTFRTCYWLWLWMIPIYNHTPQSLIPESLPRRYDSNPLPRHQLSDIHIWVVHLCLDRPLRWQNRRWRPRSVEGSWFRSKAHANTVPLRVNNKPAVSSPQYRRIR